MDLFMLYNLQIFATSVSLFSKNNRNIESIAFTMQMRNLKEKWNQYRFSYGALT